MAEALWLIKKVCLDSWHWGRQHSMETLPIESHWYEGMQIRMVNGSSVKTVKPLRVQKMTELRNQKS